LAQEDFMTRLSTRAGWAVLALMLCAATPLAASAQEAGGSQADSAAIEGLFSSFNKAFNAHDPKAMAALFADDGDFIIFGGTIRKGPAGVEQQMLTVFGRLKTLHRDVTVRDIRFLRPDVAVLHADFETSGVTNAEGAAVPPTPGFYDWIVVKTQGRWQIASWHESNGPQQGRGGRAGR
jgi:uncharacterized protein (TIGR02246 family)